MRIPGAETILVVEDEEVLREMERSILESCGYNVLGADSARKAFDLWKENAPQIRLLLADIVLPRGITGVELAKRLLDEQPHLKIIFTTGQVINQADHEALARLNARFLPKPFEPADLIRIVSDTFGGSAQGEVTVSVA